MIVAIKAAYFNLLGTDENVHKAISLISKKKTTALKSCFVLHFSALTERLRPEIA